MDVNNFTKTLTSRTWKGVTRGFDTEPRSTATREIDLETGGTTGQ